MENQLKILIPYGGTCWRARSGRWLWRCSFKYWKNEIAIDNNAGFSNDLAELIQFDLEERDLQDMLHFERA